MPSTNDQDRSRTADQADQDGDREGDSWKENYSTAQLVSLPDLSIICGEQAGGIVRNLARGVGCPEEFILMPLLVCCSALMGHRSEVRVHSAWSEPPVLWIVVGAEEGTRKSAALRQVLTPLFDLCADQRANNSVETSNDNTPLPSILTGYVTWALLRDLMHESGGCLLHVTESLETAHKKLDMHNEQRSARQILVSIYDAFAGDLAAMPLDVKTQNPAAKSGSLLSQMICYNQCGFASPEYVVKLTVKSPDWLSGRFLVSCPVVNEHLTTTFSVPVDDNDIDDYCDDDDCSSNDNAVAGRDQRRRNEEWIEDECDPPKAKKARSEALHKKNPICTLKDVYAHIAISKCRRYVFTKGARRELQRFQQEEWCTIMEQLGGRDNGGEKVSKSLGQIVRLAGVLKAMTQAVSDLTVANTATGGHTTEKGYSSQRSELLNIETEDVLRAIELGKYFLEQKLSMTFMVNTGFFRGSPTDAKSSQQAEPEQDYSQHQLSTSSASSSSQSQSRQMTEMPPPSPGNAFYGSSKLPDNVFQNQQVANVFHSAASLGKSHMMFQHPALRHLQQQQNDRLAQGLALNVSSTHDLSPLAHLQHSTFPFGFQDDNGLAGRSRAGSGCSGPQGGNRTGHNLQSEPSRSPTSTSTNSATSTLNSLDKSWCPSTSSATSSTVSALASSTTRSSPVALDIDVSQLPATWIPTTPEEEFAEMSQVADFAHLEPAQFVAIHARRVKRLLECFDDGCGVSATTAAQKSIAPPVRVAGTNNRHPAWASALFFQKVGELGLGIAEQVRHPTNGRIYWRFRRRSVAELTEKNYQLLHYLRIDMERYARRGNQTMTLLSGLGPETGTGACGYAAEHSQDDEGSNPESSKGNNSPSAPDLVEVKQEPLE